MSTTGIIYFFLLLLVALIGVARYKQLSRPFKILAWSAIALVVLGAIDRILIVKYRTNAPALQVICITEYIFYSAVYYHLFKNQTIRSFILVSIIIMAVFFTFNAAFIQPFLHKFPTNINTPAQAFNTAFALLLFKEMLDYPTKINLIKRSIFWFNTAMLFYATTMFFMLSLSNYIAEHTVDSIEIDLWFFVDYTFHILIAVAFLTNSKEPEAALTA